MPDTQPPPFDGVRVIDATVGVGGPMLGWLLAEQGADVIKVEPSSGDPLRGSPAFHVLNRSKRAVTIDLAPGLTPLPITGESLGVAALWRLIEQADVFLYDWQPGVAERLGFTADALRERNPQLVSAYLPAYGSRGPYTSLPPDEALVQALSAVCDGQYRNDPPPVLVNLPVAGYAQGILGALSVAATLYARTQSQRGDRFELSQIAATFAMEASAWVRAEKVIRMAGQHSPHGPMPTYRLVQCADGEWLFVGALTAPFWANLAIAIGLDDCLVDERFKGAPLGIADVDHRRELGDRVSASFKTKPRDEWLDILEAADVPRAPVHSREEWARDPHVVENNLMVEIDDPVLDGTRQPALPLTMRNHPGRIKGPAPRLGEHNALLSDVAGAFSPRESDSTANESTTHDRRSAPLAGITVIDLSGFIAGASASMMLADFGANVIKIEPPGGDPWRSSGLAFLGSNRGKRSVCIDLKRPEGRDLLLELIDNADVLHDNFRNGVMERMGFRWEMLSARNPRLIWSSVTGYGASGPLAHLPGFDPMMQARGGVMRAQGGPAEDGCEPVYLQMALCDFGTALTSAFGIVAALVARERSGIGDRVETSLANSALTIQAGEFIQYEGKPPERNGARDLAGHHALYRIYSTTDGYLMVACTTEQQAKAFIRAVNINIPEAALEHETHGDIAATIEAALTTRRTEDWMKIFLEQRLPVAPCIAVADMFEDAHLAANNLWRDAEHPRWGTVRQTGELVQWDELQMSLTRRAPGLDEHTAECLQELGIPEARLEALVAWSVVTQK